MFTECLGFAWAPRNNASKDITVIENSQSHLLSGFTFCTFLSGAYFSTPNAVSVYYLAVGKWPSGELVQQIPE